MLETHLPLTSGVIMMRKTPIAVAAVSLLAAALAARLTAQAGGKKKHAADTIQSAQTLQTDLTVQVPIEENTGLHRGIGKNGQIVINWVFKNGGGSANLTINQNGSYLWSGHYDNVKPNSGFDCILFVKSGDGWEWYALGNISKHGVKWHIVGQDAQLASAFGILAHEHVWGGVYRFPSVAQEKAWQKQENAQLKKECEAFAGSDKAEWAYVDPNHFCHRFNPKWY
jgi:hypothetical protein